MIPGYLLFRVDSFDLNQRCVRVLVRLRPNQNRQKKSADFNVIEAQTITIMMIRTLPLVPENRSSSVESEEEEKKQKQMLAKTEFC